MHETIGTITRTAIKVARTATMMVKNVMTNILTMVKNVITMAKTVLTLIKPVLTMAEHPECLMAHDWMYNGSHPVDWGRCLRCDAWGTREPLSATPTVYNSETSAAKISSE